MASFIGLTMVLTLTLAATPPSHAELITFDFASTSGDSAGVALDGLSSGVVTASAAGFEVTLHASAGMADSGDRFNYTSSPNFGINAAGGGDVTDAFDAGAGVSEFFELFFTASIPATFELLEVDFDRISGAGGPGEDSGLLSFPDGNAVRFDGGSVDHEDRLTVGYLLQAGEKVRFSHLDGNGFGLESLVVDVQPNLATTVPEPGTLALLALGSGLLLVKRAA